MIEMTAEWMSRAEGVKEAQDIIDAEYRILGMPQLPRSDEEEGKGPAQVATPMTEPQRTFLLRLGKEKLNLNEAQMEIECQGRLKKGLDQLTTKEASEWIDTLRTQSQGEKQQLPNWGQYYMELNRLGISADEAKDILRVSSMKDWLEAGKTLDEALKVIQKAPRQPTVPEPGGEEPLFPTEVIPEVEEPAAEEAPLFEDLIVIERNHSLIKSQNAFYNACFDDFKLQPTEALKMSGYASPTDVISWPMAYLNVAGSMGARVVMPST